MLVNKRLLAPGYRAQTLASNLAKTHNCLFPILSLLVARPGSASEGSLQRHWGSFVRRFEDTSMRRRTHHSNPQLRITRFRSPRHAGRPQAPITTRMRI
jgi:hypothetical protein